MNIDGYWDQRSIQDCATQMLEEGKSIVGTSDTVIGLLAPLTLHGKKSLDRIKGREKKPYLVLVRDYNNAAQFSDAVHRKPLKKLLASCWPGPLTIIVPANKNVPSFIQSESGAIALRVPKHEGLQSLLQSFDGLFSTSANKTGKPVPAALNEVDSTILDQAAMIIDDREKTIRKPSTILDCTGPSVKIIRDGDYSREFIGRYVVVD